MHSEPPTLDGPLLARCDLGIAARGPGGRPGVQPVHSAELCSKDSPPTFPLVSRTARDLLLQLGRDW